MRLVLDTSALLSGKMFEGELYVTPGVMRELRKHGITPQLEAFLDAKVRTLSPSPEATKKVKLKAEETGDTRRLSPVDVSILALAVDLEARIVTDDYSIENVAKAMGIPYEAVMMSPIKEEIHWRYRCTGCLKFWDEWHDPCPVCGAKLKTSRPRKR